LTKIDMSKGNGSNFHSHEPKSYQQFVQMWIVIFSYITLHQKYHQKFIQFH